MKTQIILTGAHELPAEPVGKTLTLTAYRPAEVGNGYDIASNVTGKVVAVDATLTRAYGCSFAWRGVTLLLPD